VLDQTTKRKLDSARNILVGNVTNPISQVDQITNALIYKFMDDMDQENLEVDLKPQFFVDEYKQYSWRKLMDKKLSGQERFNLYEEATKKLTYAKHIPSLFRTIFENARLPYNDPRVLTLFLKEIDEFSYSHSEELGNAFEYLLSILGSQGDAGMFRTPRHIIDFIVDIVDPKKNETILDPACGTAGFLISAYKHIVKNNDGKDNETGKPTKKETLLTPDEKLHLMNNLAGYDISPDMVKLSLVNMYLHGFQNPQIHKYDTLSSEKRWDETFDVILANPPFMSPKGGIVPHKRFSIQANRAEVLFVDYIVEHLTIKGRAGIIVPEGVIFKSDGACKALRKKLVEDGLFTVVSLPAGIFQPYSGVKTSILFFDNQLAKRSQDILFIKIENDGFDLGAQRRPIEKNDLPKAIDRIRIWKNVLNDIDKKEKLKIVGKQESVNAIWVDKEKISESGDYNLTGERYQEVEVYKKQKWEMVELGEVLEYEQPTKYIVKSVNYDDSYKTPVLTAGKTFILGYTNEEDGIFSAKNLPVIIFDDFTTAIKFVDFPFKVKSSAMKILRADKTKADARFLFQIMKTIKFRHDDHKRYWISEFSKIKIPLPPLEVQKEIVEQIEVKQSAIDHAKAIIQNLERERRYFGQSLRKLEGVKIVELGEVAEVIAGQSPEGKYYNETGEGMPFYQGKTEFSELYIGKPKVWTTKITKIAERDDILMSVRAPVGPVNIATEKVCIGRGLASIRANKVDPMFLFNFLKSIDNKIKGNGGAVFDSINKKQIEELKIPLPSLEIQKKLVAEAEKEQQIINANKQLIEIYEQKISDVLSEI